MQIVGHALVELADKELWSDSSEISLREEKHNTDTCLMLRSGLVDAVYCWLSIPPQAPSGAPGQPLRFQFPVQARATLGAHWNDMR